MPESVYDNFEPPMEISKESDAINRICLLANRVKDREPDIQLRDFSIYRRSRPGEFHLASLHHLQIRWGSNEFFVDGVLHYQNERSYVQRVPFIVLSIPGYGDKMTETVKGSIWIQSQYLEGTKWFYRLGNPSSRYSKMYSAFLWISDLTKHFIGYLQEIVTVTLENFETYFHDWFFREHSTSTVVEKWAEAYSTKDFRLPVVTYREFLWKESVGVEGSGEGITRDQIWEQISPYSMGAVKHELTKTTVTPFIYECFWHSYFASKLHLCPYENLSVVQQRATRNVSTRVQPRQATF